MKKIFLLTFFALPLTGFAQSKLRYDRVFSVAGVSNPFSKAVTTSNG